MSTIEDQVRESQEISARGHALIAASLILPTKTPTPEILNYAEMLAGWILEG